MRTRKLCHAETFPQRTLYTEGLLHTHSIFYTEKSLHRVSPGSCTEELLHSESFTQELLHRADFTQALVHAETFKQGSLDTHTHTHFTHRSLYREKLLTQSNFYAPKHFHTETFPQRLSHRDLCTHRCFYTHRNFYKEKISHKETLPQCLPFDIHVDATKELLHRRT